MAFGHERDGMPTRRPWWAAVGFGVSAVGLLIAWFAWRRSRSHPASVHQE
jgi:hypothetical protein